MDVLAGLLFLIAVLFLLAVALGMLGVVGRALHWALDSWGGQGRRVRLAVMAAAGSEPITA